MSTAREAVETAYARAEAAARVVKAAREWAASELSLGQGARPLAEQGERHHEATEALRAAVQKYDTLCNGDV